jgi:galactose mutarotase-like enzyme
LELRATNVTAVVDLVAGGRISSFVVDGRELLKTGDDDPVRWGSFPMVPFAGRVRDAVLHFEGVDLPLPPRYPPHAIHGTGIDRRWDVVGESTIATDLGPDWPFRGRAVQRFELGPDHLTCRLELHADEPMPASIGWHPWFLRRIPGTPGELELDVEPGAMYARDAAGIATTELVPPAPEPWDDCFTDLRRPPVLRWPGFLEVTIASDCPDWVIYTSPPDALCVEPQTAPPDALNTDPTVVQPPLYDTLP